MFDLIKEGLAMQAASVGKQIMEPICGTCFGQRRVPRGDAVVTCGTCGGAGKVRVVVDRGAV